MDFLRQRVVWGVLLSRFFEEPVSWFYFTWLPLYMRSYRHISMTDTGVALIVPFVALDIGYIVGGWSSSRLMLLGWSVNWARKTVMVLSALCMVSGIPAATTHSTSAFIALVSVAMLGHGGWGTNVSTLPSDLAPSRSVGTIYGLTAFAGGLGAIVFTRIIGILVDSQHSFQMVFIIAGSLPIVAALVLLTVPGDIVPIGSNAASTHAVPIKK
jgi:MFS transporter, ACS family, hexuronate transporter